MEKIIQVLNRSTLLGKEIDVYGTVLEPLFRAQDVANWIEHSDAQKMIQSVDDDEKLLRTMFGTGQRRNVWFLTENGLYEVLMLSRKPIAKEFKKGVKKILHEIRIHGSFTVPQTFAEALRLAADQQEEIERQKSQIAFQQQDIDNKKRQIEESKPKVAMYDSVINKLDTFDIATVAKMLNFDRVGRNTMFKILKEQFIFMPNNQPFQKYVDQGYFKVIMVECKDYILRPKAVAYPKGVELIRQRLVELGYKQKKLEKSLAITGELPIFATIQ